MPLDNFEDQGDEESRSSDVNSREGKVSRIEQENVNQLISFEILNRNKEVLRYCTSLKKEASDWFVLNLDRLTAYVF
jgi:hypothetical protein